MNEELYKQFKLIKSYVESDIEQQITSLLNQGWKLHGQLYIMPTEPPKETNYYYYPFTFFQAMFKE